MRPSTFMGIAGGAAMVGAVYVAVTDRPHFVGLSLLAVVFSLLATAAWSRGR